MAFSGSYLTSAIQPYFTSPLASNNGLTTAAQLQQSNDPAGQQALFNSQNQRTVGGIGMDITMAALAAMGAASFPGFGAAASTGADAATSAGFDFGAANNAVMSGASSLAGSAGVDTSFTGALGSLGSGAGLDVGAGGLGAATTAGATSGSLGDTNLFNFGNATGNSSMTDFSNLYADPSVTTTPDYFGMSENPVDQVNLSNSSQLMSGAPNTMTFGTAGGSTLGNSLSSLLQSGGLGQDAVKAISQYLQQSGLSSNLTSAANQAATLNNPMLQPQRFPYQDALLGMQTNPQDFMNTNPLVQALKTSDAQAFQAQAAKSGMGGTSISNYLNNLNTGLAGTYNTQYQNLLTAGGFTQGTGQAGSAAAPLLNSAANASGNQFLGLTNALSNNSTIQGAISGAGQALGDGASSLFNDVSNFFS